MTPPTFSDDAQHARAIRREIMAAVADARTRYRWLSYQNALGMGIFIVSTSAIVASWYAYAYAALPAWVVVVWVAFWASLLHELEHDLIHALYFKANATIRNAMMFGVWLFRPTTLNPFFRAHLHIHHHAHSGTLIDIEEISVTNGDRWTLRRLLITSDLVLAYLLRLPELRRNYAAQLKQGKLAPEDMQAFRRAMWFGMLPFGIIAHLLWYAFLAYHAAIGVASWLPNAPAMPAVVDMAMTVVAPFVVCWIAPNMLRQFCLHFITSNMHYFGDVEEGNLMQQTQVLNASWTLPFQLFCFNFGSTHGIHHFVVNEPFYLRQMIARRAHRVMKAEGVRFNDVGTFARANRFNKAV